MIIFGVLTLILIYLLITGRKKDLKEKYDFPTQKINFEQSLKEIKEWRPKKHGELLVKVKSFKEMESALLGRLQALISDDKLRFFNGFFIELKSKYLYGEISTNKVLEVYSNIAEKIGLEIETPILETEELKIQFILGHELLNNSEKKVVEKTGMKTSWKKISETREKYLKYDDNGKIIEEILYSMQGQEGARILRREHPKKKYYKYENIKEIEIDERTYDFLYEQNVLTNKPRYNIEDLNNKFNNEFIKSIEGGFNQNEYNELFFKEQYTEKMLIALENLDNALNCSDVSIKKAINKVNEIHKKLFQDIDIPIYIDCIVEELVELLEKVNDYDYWDEYYFNEKYNGNNRYVFKQESHIYSVKFENCEILREAYSLFEIILNYYG